MKVKESEVRAFRRLARRFHRQTGALLWGRTCCAGVTVGQGHVLLELKDLGDATLQALADALRLDKSTTSRTVHTLVARGLVRRTTSGADRRCLVLTLSPTGRNKVAEIDAAGDENGQRIFRAMPRARRKDAVDCLRLIVEAGDRVEGDRCPVRQSRREEIRS